MKKLALACCLSFLVGAFGSFKLAEHATEKQPVYALSPEDCNQLGLKFSGWTQYSEYNGGINHGGITSALGFECK